MTIYLALLSDRLEITFIDEEGNSDSDYISRDRLKEWLEGGKKVE